MTSWTRCLVHTIAPPVRRHLVHVATRTATRTRPPGVALSHASPIARLRFSRSWSSAAAAAPGAGRNERGGARGRSPSVAELIRVTRKTPSRKRNLPRERREEWKQRQAPRSPRQGRGDGAAGARRAGGGGVKPHLRARSRRERFPEEGGDVPLPFGVAVPRGREAEERFPHLQHVARGRRGYQDWSVLPPTAQRVLHDDLKALIGEAVSLRECWEALQLRPVQVETMVKHLHAVWYANRFINLVSRKSSTRDLVRRHLVDSLLALPHIPPSATCIADIGSGGGFPSVPLAVAMPTRTFVVYEKSGKKHELLASLALGLPVQNIRKVERAVTGEALNETHANLVTARAYGSVGRVISDTQAYFDRGGMYMLYVGREDTVLEQIKECKLGEGQYKLVPLRAPGAVSAPPVDEERNLLFVSRFGYPLKEVGKASEKV